MLRPAELAVVDSDSFGVSGYFEETKLARIHPNDAAEIRLMSGGPALTGHVQGISYGITDPDNPPGPQLLPNVNPIFSWVRLAQRFPVRIELDPLPPGATIRSGMTCSVTIQGG